MEGIDRRAKRDLLLFLLTQPERYETLEFYRPRTLGFGEVVRPLLPAGWTLGENQGVWRQVHPPEDRTPVVGFKIHLSARPESARTLLETLVPLLVREGVAFKFLVDEAMLDLNNSSLLAGGSCGKFVTVYPTSPEQFARLMNRLHEATRDLEGPYILSDKRFKDSKVLFYRYGAFRSHASINLYGEQELFFLDAQGRRVPDLRLPYFVLPEGVEDPFPDTDDGTGEPLLNGRYQALSVLGSSSKGGVYRCLDLRTHQEVVVKEARPLINKSRHSPEDAVSCLANEQRILTLLEGSGVAPRVLDSFQEWEHHFLVMELAPGEPLSDLLTQEHFNLVIQTAPGREDLRRYCERFLHIARRLIAGVRAIHERGVVIQDLAPQNILYDPERGTVTFIDFESAWSERGGVTSPVIPMRTLGFGARGSEGSGPPTLAEDDHALSCILGELLYPISRFFALAPGHRRSLLKHVAEEKGVPEVFLRLIFATEEQPEQLDALLEEAQRSLEAISDPPLLKPQREESSLRPLLGRIADYIEAESRQAKHPLDLPTDYRRYVTNDLSVAYGASGIALFLKRARGELPPAFLEALVSRAAMIDNLHYPPGLYVGASGVAWTLLELGRREEAEALLATVADSPLLGESADLFYGAAGWGLTNLFFFDRLRDERYLRRAREAFQSIQPRLHKAERGYGYVNGDDTYCGLAHGSSGIGYFCLKLFQATGQAEHLECARALLDFELSRAEERDEELIFRRSEREPLIYPYWRIGGAGVGSLCLRFHAVLGEERYLQVARKLVRTLKGKYSAFPSNLSGMVGIGHFFLDLALHTGEQEARDEARRFLDRVMLFALERPSGVVMPGEELLRLSTDYATGSSGLGVFVHRLLTGAGIPYLDF